MASQEIQFCWEDDNSCICGNGCEPPKWLQTQWQKERKEEAPQQFDNTVEPALDFWL